VAAILKPGDTLRYRLTDDGILLDKATEGGDGPFAAFSEWASTATMARASRLQYARS
jgi:hypothetical protein